MPYLPTAASSPAEVALAVAGHCRALTPARAMQSAQVAALTKTGGDEVADDAAEALANLLTYTAHQFNIGKNLSAVQLALLSADLLATYWYWRFDEFALVLRDAVRGKFGTSYDRLDAPTIHGWCLAYEKDRDALLDAEAQRRHKAHRLAENGREELLPAEQMPYFYLRSKLEAQPDAELERGIRYYLRHADAPQAAFKRDTAVEVLADRLAFAATEARPLLPTEQEAAYQQWRAGYLTEKMAREAAETSAVDVTDEAPTDAPAAG